MGGLSSKPSSVAYPPLTTVPQCITDKFMGTWFVIGVKPTIFETTCSNAVETYTRVTPSASGKGSSSKHHDIDIDFQYNKSDPITSPLKSLGQRGWIQGTDKENSSKWVISPFGPIRLPYPVIELDEIDYQYTVIGHEERKYVWIRARKPVMEDELYDSLTKKLVEKHQYDLNGLRRVPQKWTREERAKRKLDNIIPDDLLVN
jgi:apolipoprotein D and lipocalin family protein